VGKRPAGSRLWVECLGMVAWRRLRNVSTSGSTSFGGEIEGVRLGLAHVGIFRSEDRTQDNTGGVKGF